MIDRWWRRNRDLFMAILALLLWAGIFTMFLLCYLGHVMGLSTLIEIIAGFTISGMAFYIFYIANKERALLIGFTSRYLIEKDESRLDDLLGILIAGKWKQLRLDPVDEFFSLMKSLCYKDSYETKRRIAEALPALFKINLYETKEIVELLRCDWDEKRWKADNRRRTLEALHYIIKKAKGIVKVNLRLIPKDEIFTVIALVELMNVWRDTINKRAGDKLFSTLIDDMKKMQFSENEIASMVKFWDFLKLISSSKSQALERFKTLKSSSDVYLQIGIARNLKSLCQGYPKCRTKNWCSGDPDCIIDAISFFLNKDLEKNVRRPMARGEMLECILVLLRYERYAHRAKEIIQALICDEDDIIRLAAFDRIENILAVDVQFGQGILENVIAANNNPKLVDRAKTLHTRLIQSSVQ